MIERYFLAFLLELEVAVGIHQGIDAVVAWCYAAYHESSATVCTAHSEHRLCLESGVGLVGIESHEDTLYRLQILCFEHTSRHFERVNGVARGETVGVVAHRVSLVVVRNGIAEVDGVSGVRNERVLQLYLYLLSCRLYLGHFQLRRAHHHLLLGVFQFHIFIEEDAYLAR